MSYNSTALQQRYKEYDYKKGAQQAVQYFLWWFYETFHLNQKFIFKLQKNTLILNQKNTCRDGLRAINGLLTKQNRGTYTKSQDMKMFIIDTIILQLNKDLNIFITFHCISDYDRKQNIGTYTKSQDMKRFIINAIIHCNWTRIRTNLLRFTLHCVSDYNRKLREEICKRKVVVVRYFQSINRRLFKNPKWQKK